MMAFPAAASRRLADAAHPHDFSRDAHTELLLIEKTTTLRDSTRAVRWNQADHRLAHGL
ncbi:hypothetical protein BJQ94_01840 [Cryobacterium sp. SO2]|uniref:hypothetical protein n=1 Tax=Cryobacterium sp. SO2 TaxID=1897060 RepID=UPI00223DE88A|nr:hypothetical protein [Cryobacterium sp. SO2]WEO79417.1 hypothetical protein BJQ94_01840 [Cryobacterium sp. SO2]